VKMTDTTTMRIAGRIWDYLSVMQKTGKSDAIVVCCSYDLRVCDHACGLIRAGYSNTLVISGGSSNWTRHLWPVPEAEVFFARALENGLDEGQILLEQKSSNFGENIRFSRKLIPEAGTVTFVAKPNSLLRVRLTAKAQWPGLNALVSAPNIRFPDEVSNAIGIWGVINEMVGDLQRIREYPALGYQVEHELPPEILQDWVYLVENGFTYHLMPGKRGQADLATADAALPAR